MVRAGELGMRHNRRPAVADNRSSSRRDASKLDVEGVLVSAGGLPLRPRGTRSTASKCSRARSPLRPPQPPTRRIDEVALADALLAQMSDSEDEAPKRNRRHSPKSPNRHATTPHRVAIKTHPLRSGALRPTASRPAHACASASDWDPDSDSDSDWDVEILDPLPPPTE